MSNMTVVICNYNYGEYLRGAIDSALKQTAGATQVLVIDDGSTDDSRDIIHSYGERITAIFQENGGQVAAYNRALEHIDSTYVIFLDADDLLYADAVSRVIAAFSSGDYVKVQFTLDVVTHEGAKTGVTVPQSMAVADCGKLLRAGWLYPSPPGSGNAYRVAALKRIFPIPVTTDNLYGADFYAIYGIALLGDVYMLDLPLGGYRVHRSAASVASGANGSAAALAFANSEGPLASAKKAESRWSTLRVVVQRRLGETLPVAFFDFSTEKAHFASRLYQAPLARRWRWFMLESGSYFHTVLANPFWSIRKKFAVSCLTVLCLSPLASVSDRAVRYIANPLSRAGRVGKLRSDAS
ncbi:glycosyltransferase family 2 protein [Paraburkholderia sp. RP-4-7]|jgi:glycosyltransferase involved in cell wall biosynthesis|uniref:Glycosyltransferase family 2 protein n=1 Tax=Paraburkholderia polaris TaxID=2728848 RepID=A0A848IKE3_9BURK|nr:glycosyltransferase family A protein [Paraburkholderia polaris]NMM02191.1 glycosyltransferase family 2 protein [Paraburkholderia polaris]